MRASDVLGGWCAVLLCLGGCARARSATDGVEQSGAQIQQSAAGAAADGARASELQRSRRRSADLVLEAPSEGSVVQFKHREIAEDSCELYEGCALGTGNRSIAEIKVVVRNVGGRALDLGAPWQSEYFYPSLCQSTQLLYGFISAEVRDVNNVVVSQGSLSTACIADAAGGYSCTAQGIGAGGAVAGQPTGQCDFVDMTALETGDYTLRLTVNPNGELREATRANNTLDVPLSYLACDGTFCGSECCPQGVACEDGACVQPDFRINRESAAQSLWLSHETFAADSCELEERCVSGSGERRLLNFEGRIENVGRADFSPGPEEDNPLFEYSACHDHYHFRDFTDYRLLDASGQPVAVGHKQSFCLVNSAPVDVEDTPAPPGTRPEPFPQRLEEVPHLEEPGGGGCNFLRAGWADIYPVGTPCQWIDVTDVPAGDYTLQLAVNPTGAVHESNLDNNIVTIPFHLDADAPCVPQREICGDPIDQDCDNVPDTWDEDCNDGCYPGSPFCVPIIEVNDNDSCATAYELPDIGTYRGWLPASDPALPAACGGAGAAGYFRFSLEVEQAVYLGALISGLDTVIGVFRDDCSGEPIHCSDDACGARGGHFVEILPAGDYVAVVRAKNIGQAGSYQLKFQHDAPQGARIIQGPGVYAGDTTNAENRIAACEGYGPEPFATGPEQRYVLATCNSQLTVSTCGASTFRSILEARQVSTDPFFEPVQCSLPEWDYCEADPYGSLLTAYVPSSGLTFLTIDGESAEDFGEYQLTIAY
jgi:hypothetical protein